jgi:UDP-glucuronate decarboxylase
MVNETPTPKKVLVTGGAGFLGSHLCARLLDLGHEVIALDNLYTGNKANISFLLGHPRFSFLMHDIIEPIDIAVDWIFNFACPASPVHYQKDPVYTTRTSVLGALNMLELARTCRARIMQASTSEVYGDPEQHPQTESYRGCVNPIGIRSCYDEGKRCAESLFFDYHRMYQTDIKVIRIFNTYGPYMDKDDGRVVSNFVVSALKGEPLILYGDGTQTRSFCYVEDLINGIIAMMYSESAIQGPINLGNDQEFTLLQLVETLALVLDTSLNVGFKELPHDDPTRRRPDLTIAKTLLQWQPKVTLADGLAKTIDYFSRIVSVREE